jgi:GTP-binding protein
MKLFTAEFIKSAMRPADYPRDGHAEFAFVGRSNVGKSTLLNTLLRKKNLAKTSGTPGKTQTINFFLVNGRFYFVDLPGYGYAQVPKALKDAWNKTMAAYLRERAPLRLAVMLVDARHAPTALDHEMLDLLESAEKPTLVVATKVDKLKRSERNPNLARIREVLDLSEEALVIPFSGETGEGVQDLWRVIEGLL